MRKPVNKLLCGLLLLACAGTAFAQSGAATQYGKVGGMNAGNAQACGATPAQVAKLRESHKNSARQLFGSEADFDKAYDTAASGSEQKIVQAFKQGQYKPKPEVCTELMQQVRK